MIDVDGPRTKKPVEARLRVVKAPWKSGLVLVCRECDGHPKSVRRGLKDVLAETGLRKRVRVVSCGCLDVCPKRAVTVVTVATFGDALPVCSVVPDEATHRTDLRPLLRRFETQPPGNDTTEATEVEGSL